ncbi:MULTISPECIES: S8 family serine peptidase [unclassified Streptomyces]|uniref:S8 family serine peptidase n=1 Tax=unclassified Streptomyces TaxID=2593676 RepID=UPI00278C3DBD|nr:MULTISPECIES: S8 family serine peptidase [unclassified Streptomyces]
MPQPRPPRRSHTARAAAALTAAAALLTCALPALAAPAQAAAPASDKVDSALTKAVSQKDDDATFFVVLKETADLTTAKRRPSHAKAATATYKALKATAADSQKSLTAFLDKEKVGHKDYWIANAVQVTGDRALVNKLAARSDVQHLVKARKYKPSTIETSDTGADAEVTGSRTTTATTPDWGISDIKADQVWDQYQDKGEGIVVASVDSGVQYDHPDLVANYRGNNGDGTFTHDYNFYDPSGTCPTSTTPCDNSGHGTHTMGTMVGKNGIGVAPNAKWIAAKGCETAEYCTDGSLLAAGQWILAPTDHNGQNPRPDLAPNIVNNSWGGGETTFYEDVVEAWNSAGIFEAFAAGNDGDGKTCSTTAAPGSLDSTYGVGAYDSSGTIANFSGFGPSPVDGSAKPNISAPGVDITSAWPGSAYNTIDGTSMATPHVAGAVALLWAAAPELIGDIDETRRLLGEGARDVDDTHCGGTAGMNNVWGEGKLDVLASVDAAPHSAVHVSGTVTDEATGKALPHITVTTSNATTGTRTVGTGSDGTYRLTLPPGTYDVTLSGYGYRPKTLSGVQLTTGSPLTQDVALTPAPSHAVSGTVLDLTGKPLKGATVELNGSPLAPVTSGSDGTFALPKVAEGTYSLYVKPAQPVLCNGTSTGSLTVDGAESRTIRLPARTDAAGHSCAPATYSWIPGSSKVALSGDEDAKTVALPFPVPFYGVKYSSAAVTTDGLINFLSPRIGDYANEALPTEAQPNGIVAPLWDDLTLDKKSSVQTATTGTSGSRKFAVVWNNVLFAGGTDRATFEAVFDEATGAITFQYKSVPGAGASATVGIENQAGTDALQYAHDQAVLTAGSAIRIAQGAK